jgi:hypothetical protein
MATEPGPAPSDRGRLRSQRLRERAIIEQAGFELVAAQCKTEDEVIDVGPRRRRCRGPIRDDQRPRDRLAVRVSCDRALRHRRRHRRRRGGHQTVAPSTGRSARAGSRAGLDDIEEEPAKVRDWRPDNPLFSLDNVIITPHAAYYSEEAIDTVRRFAAEEVVRVLTGQPPLSPVNAGELVDARWSPSP